MTFLRLVRDVAKLGARKCPEHDMAVKEDNWGNRPKTIGLRSNTGCVEMSALANRGHSPIV